MTKPKLTIVDADTIPDCPHCGGDLLAATVTVDDLLTHYPFGGWIAIREDGYAREGEHLTASCPHCQKPVAIGFEVVGQFEDWRAKFAAARTKRDMERLGEWPRRAGAIDYPGAVAIAAARFVTETT